MVDKEPVGGRMYNEMDIPLPLLVLRIESTSNTSDQKFDKVRATRGGFIERTPRVVPLWRNPLYLS